MGRTPSSARDPLVALLVCLLLAQTGCVSREQAAGAAYSKAESAFRAGDFNLSLTLADKGLRRYSEGDWSWRFRLLSAEALSYLGHSREAASRIASGQGPPAADLRARWILDRARFSGGPNAGKMMQQALEMALGAGNQRLVCLIRMRLGEAANDFKTGEGYYRAALAGAERLHDPYWIAWSRMGLGYNRAKAARFDEAIPYLADARDRAQRIGAKALVVGSLGNLGWCYVSLGNLQRAMDAYTRAEELSEKIGWRDVQHRWLTSIGNIYMAWGELDRAAEYQQRALGIAQGLNNEAWTAIILSNRSQLSVVKGDLPAARDFNDRALTIKRKLRDPWSLAYSEWNAANIESRSGKFTEAEQDYQRVIQKAPEAHAPEVLWAAYGGLAVLYQETHRPKLAEAQFRNAIDTIDREWSKLISDDSKVTFLSPGNYIEFFKEYVEFLIRNGQSERALQVAESSRARVLSQQLERAETVPPDFRMDRLAAAARQARTVILSYWLASNRSSVWVIGSGAPARVDLPPAKEFAELVKQHTGMVTQGGDPLALGDGKASALYQAVVAPVARLIPAGWNVIVVPDGELHQVAFETLVVPGPKPHYWIEDVSIATAPSLRVLRDEGLRPPRAPKLLLMGDPVLIGQEFPPLPNVRKEIAAVEEQFAPANRTVLTGAQAIPVAYAKASPESFTGIHFATHATAVRESPLNSAIILSHQGESYKLYARDVAALPLNADLVTLSACTSAGATAYSGEGLMGFAWAFLHAGARNVIASLWDVDDARSADMMRGLYAGMAAGQSPARALRSAKLALLHSGSSARLPYYWGPLEVFTTRIAQ